MKISFISGFLISLLIFKPIAANRESDDMILSRNKRYLIFPKGSSFMQMVLGFGLPFEVNKQSVTIGPFIKALYYFPTNSTAFTNPSYDIEIEETPIEPEQEPADDLEDRRRKRAASTRWNFYQMLSSAAQLLGYGGKACVLRAICETAEAPFSERGGIIGEMFHVIFTPSSSLEETGNHLDNDYYAAEQLGRNQKNCGYFFPECKVNLMEQFTEIYSH